MTDVVGSSSPGDVPSGFKYWAFLSYSHRDDRIASRLHQQLENYRIPKPLVGQAGRIGPVPKNLFPIFRDREELAASAELSDSIRAAISESAYLIVICSPDAAQSRWVHEEVLVFKRLGREDRILAVIASGEPLAKDRDNECFPLSLRHRLDGNGELQDATVEPIAADLRPQGDGEEGCKLKLIAGILGVPLNELRRRELIAARKRARVFQGISVAMTLLAVLATAGGWVAYQNQQKAEQRLDVSIDIASGVVGQAMSLSKKFGIPSSAIGSLLDWSKESFNRLSKEDLPDKLKHRQAFVLLLLSSHYGVSGNADRQLAVALEARDLLTPLVKSDPGNGTWQSTLSAIHGQIGDAQRAQGRFAKALDAYKEALAIDEGLFAKGTHESKCSEAVAVRMERIGTTLALQGALEEALLAQEGSLLTAKRLVADCPLELGTQQLLAIQHEKVGELKIRLDRGEEGLMSHRSALKIRSALSERFQDNSALRRELGVSYNQIGRILLSRGDVAGALGAHESALDIARSLQTSDREHADWKHDLAAVQLALGDALHQNGNVEQAQDMYRAALAIAEELVAAAPRQWIYQFALANAIERTGDVQLAMRQPEAALHSYRRKLDILKQLIAEEPDTGEWERDLVIAHRKVGEALEARPATARDVRDVRDSYAQALALAQKMQAVGRLDPADAGMIPDLQGRVAKWSRLEGRISERLMSGKGW